METTSQNEFGLSDVPRPVLKGFMETYERQRTSLYINVYASPISFSRDIGTTTWELNYEASDKTLFVRKYNNPTVKEFTYVLDGEDGIKNDFVVRRGPMELLNERKYHPCIIKSGEPDIWITYNH